MKVLLVIALLVVCASAAKPRRDAVLSPSSQSPWMAALGYLDGSNIRYICGGVLISEKFLLAAAHCVTGVRGPITVRFGNSDHQSNYRIKEMIQHPEFSIRTKHNDIALIQLNDAISSDIIRPASLHTNTSDLAGNLKLAKVISNAKTERLNNVVSEVKTVPLSECKQIYSNYSQLAQREIDINESQYCAEDVDDSCERLDVIRSGNSIFYTTDSSDTAHVVGISSFGIGCSAMPVIYDRVAHYLDWIHSYVQLPGATIPKPIDF